MKFETWGMTGTLVTSDPERLGEAEIILWRGIHAIDDVANRFRPDSEICRLNRQAGRGPVKVSPLLLRLLKVAQSAFDATQGLCDATVLPSLEALGYDKDFELIALTSQPQRTVPVPVGMQRVQIDEATHTVTLPANAALDFGALAKAFTIDEVADELTRLGGGVIEIGGDLAVRGTDGVAPWVISIADSLNVTGAEPRVALGEGAVATSSTRERRWDVAGTSVHHIIDPRTGRPAVSPYRQITVTAPTCVQANALATAAFCWGDEATYHVAQGGGAGRFVRADGAIEYVGGWPADEKVVA
jgi:FAD:protein FMN transferase